MYLINTSFHAERSVAAAVIDSVGSQLRPLMTASGLFTDLLMAEILVEVDPDCVSFTLQGKTSDIEKATSWLHDEAQEYFDNLQRNYSGKVVYFTTPMRIL